MSATLSKENTKLGLIGIGLMGSRFLRRLNAEGWNIRGWNRSKGATLPLKKYGLQIEEMLAGLVGKSDVLLSSLADDNAVRTVYLGENGVFTYVKPQTIILEMSTISPRSLRASPPGGGAARSASARPCRLRFDAGSRCRYGHTVRGRRAGDLRPLHSAL